MTALSGIDETSTVRNYFPHPRNGHEFAGVYSTQEPLDLIRLPAREHLASQTFRGSSQLIPLWMRPRAAVTRHTKFAALLLNRAPNSRLRTPCACSCVPLWPL